MTDDPFAAVHAPVPGTAEEITEILRTAAAQIESANLQMSWIEEHQAKLIGYLHDLLDRVGKLEAERNAAECRAGEMQAYCDIYKGKAEDLGSKLHAARQLNAKLGIQTGEARCPECGSASVALIHGYFPTGEGEAVTPYEAALDCQECGHREEMAP